jgi:hypothetical protein
MSVNENGNGNSRLSSSPHPEHDEEREYQLCRMEMKRIRAARAAAANKEVEAGYRRERRMNACDLNGHEFAIVCEELWVDFKKWVGHHENMKNCIDKTNYAVKKNLGTILSVCMFLVWFRWYMGGGKEACAKFSIGGIMLSFVCELFRYIGEALVGVFIGIVGFCVGILPLLVCVCVYEFHDAFPDPDTDADADADADAHAEDSGHLKKE